jgi:HSP20 family protein
VDEYREDGSPVVRAEVSGIDPDKDLEVTTSEGVLHIVVERHMPKEKASPKVKRIPVMKG